MNPCSAYGEAKRISELLCSIAASHSALEVKIARCFAFVGPHLPLDSHYAIGNFIYDAINSKNILIQGNGSPLRSYLYASDLMIWLWTLLFNGKSSQIYNIGSEHAISIAELAHLIAKMSGNISNVIIKKPYANGDPIERYIPSTKRAENDLGLKQLISLEKALKRTINWYKTKKL
jgi:dTDP-glucose 4,6-dehydratase